MSERKVCTFCGREGHRASQCPQRRSAVLKAKAADTAAGLLLAATAAARWLHGRPDVLTTGAALIAAAAALYLIHAGA
jgi:hypothetical protein